MLSSAFTEHCQAAFGDRFTVSRPVRDAHGRDESPFPCTPPDAVIFAESVADIVRAVGLCSEFGVPIIPYGAGSSIEGHLLAVRGGVSLDVSRLNRILAIHAEDMTAVVEPGVTRKQLNAALAGTGLFFPIDPGADASLGGMAATRASGTNAVRYGSMRENVLGLKVVTADGQLVKTGTRARKSAAGYDLTRLFVGSEGTLGVIAEVTVKLHPIPEVLAAAVVSFATIADAVNCVIGVIQLGVELSRCEFLCERMIAAINAYSRSGLTEAPTLFIEFQGSAPALEHQIEQVKDLAGEFGGLDFQWALKPEERSQLWQARHNALLAGLQTRPGARAISTDTCVPISRLADSLVGARQILDESRIPSMLVGHVGDGNFHALMLVDPADPHELERAEAANRRIVELALAMDGTCSGEHGIGLHKMDFLRQEAGAEGIALMRTLKQALDPANIMNPGKIFA